MATFYALDVQKSGVRGELRINGVPLEIWPDGRATHTTQGINHWITGRPNVVTIALTSPLPPRAPARIEVVVFAASAPGQATGDARPLARLEWPGAAGVDPAAPEVSVSFEAPEVPPSAFWPGARPLALDPAATAGLLALVEGLHSALDRRDLVSAGAMLEFKAVDVGAAIYMPPDRARASQREFLEVFLDDPGFRMEPIVPGELGFRLVADQRLVWVTRLRLQPVLQSSGRGPRLQLPVYAAPVQGRWTVVR